MEPTTEQLKTDTAPVKYAGFWWRFLAYLIDDIILSFVGFLLLIPIWMAIGVSFYGLFARQGCDWDLEYGYDPELWGIIGSFIVLMIISSVIALALNWLYFALMESSRFQATLGKMAVGVKVTDMKGNRISFGRATGRYFGKIISAMILYIGFIMAGFTEKKQALHDMLANTLVIKM